MEDQVVKIKQNLKEDYDR
jgi:hypothetical protein